MQLIDKKYDRPSNIPDRNIGTYIIKIVENMSTKDNGFSFALGIMFYQQTKKKPKTKYE